MNKNIKKVVIYNCSGLGNFIWATSAISLIKSYDKNIHLTLITHKTYLPLIDKKLQIDRIISVNKKINDSANTLYRLLYRFFWFSINFFKLRKTDTFVFLDVSVFISFAVKYIFNIKKIVGPALWHCGYNTINPYNKYYTDPVWLPKDADRTNSMIWYQMIVRSVFMTYNMAIPLLPPPDTHYTKIKRAILDTKKYKIAVCTNGSSKIQDWPIDYFKTLLNKINNKYNVSFFIVGSTDKQNDTAEYLKKRIQNADIRNLCKETSLLELSLLLQNMDLLITVDTGIAHLAAFYKIKTIDLIGHVTPEKVRPVNPKAVCVYSSYSCSPCTKNSLQCTDPKCMSDITPDMVLREAENILTV